MANYLIYAASSDIGCSTSKMLLNAGHSLFITSRTRESLERFQTLRDLPSLCAMRQTSIQ